ncbi:MAG: prepilin-type N-terminal cleavage/methylation domain-containing protein [Planctomycetota bacterium]
MRTVPRGMTLFELLLVLSVLGVVGVLAVPALSRRGEQASVETTMQSMVQLRQAIMGEFRDDMFESLPFPVDPARLAHPQLKFLYDNPDAYLEADPDSVEFTKRWSYDPLTGRGWSGPYIDHGMSVPARYQVNTNGFTREYGEDGDPAPVDGWGRPIVLQQPVPAGVAFSSTSVNYARLVSAGPDGILQTPLIVLEPSEAQTGDDLIVYLRNR